MCPEGPGKGDYSDFSKVCYLGCKKTIDSWKVMMGLRQGSYRARMWWPTMTCFLLGIFMFRPLSVVTFGICVYKTHKAGLPWAWQVYMWHLFLPHNCKTGRTGTRNYPVFRGNEKSWKEGSFWMFSGYALICAVLDGLVVFTDDDYSEVWKIKPQTSVERLLYKNFTKNMKS